MTKGGSVTDVKIHSISGPRGVAKARNPLTAAKTSNLRDGKPYLNRRTTSTSSYFLRKCSHTFFLGKETPVVSHGLFEIRCWACELLLLSKRAYS